MSKSLGNGIEPQEIVDQYGADILRLWVASSDYHADIRISKDILKQLSELTGRSGIPPGIFWAISMTSTRIPIECPWISFCPSTSGR